MRSFQRCERAAICGMDVLILVQVREFFVRRL
jgi:hypothetical protein